MTGSGAEERVALVGDVGGHADQLRRALVGLGADPDAGRLPDGLVVVQVGDLVQRGPDSEGAVDVVDRFLRRHPDRWVQLEGNHESCYVRADRFFHDDISADAAATLRGWADDGLVRLAVALETEALGPVLVSHAGVTARLWDELGRPASPPDAVRALEENQDLAARAGSMLGEPEGLGGVLWAEAVDELYQPWLDRHRSGEALPFSQVHGHTTAWWWSRGRTTARGELRDLLQVDHARRHVRVDLGDASLVGVDPGFGATATDVWAPLVLEGRVVA